MAIRVMNEVWEHAPYEGGELLVLLALADWANAQDKCWPSVSSIARKARISERQVYNILRKLSDDGVIEREGGGGRGNASVYVINTAIISGFSNKTETLKSATETLKSATETLKSATRNPEICDNPPDPLIGRTTKEPLREPPQEPPTAVREAAQAVCLAYTFADQAIEDAICEAIVLAMRHPECELGPVQIAESMKRRWGEYRDACDNGLLRYHWGPRAFFRGGHWRPDAAWPIDQQALRLYREARVGMVR